MSFNQHEGCNTECRTMLTAIRSNTIILPAVVVAGAVIVVVAAATAVVASSLFGVVEDDPFTTVKIALSGQRNLTKCHIAGDFLPARC